MQSFFRTLGYPESVADLLGGIATNCVPRSVWSEMIKQPDVRHGPESQNREAHPHFREHLAGRIGFMKSIHAEKGRRLRAIFDQIEWSEA